eukprot:1075061-Pleurochrysis_carterae.AAC.19
MEPCAPSLTQRQPHGRPRWLPRLLELQLSPRRRLPKVRRPEEVSAQEHRTLEGTLEAEVALSKAG